MRIGIDRSLLPELKYLVKNTVVDKWMLTEIIRSCFDYILRELSAELTIWINSKVPMDLGLLRLDLLKTLQQSYSEYGFLEILLGTDLEYAERVAAMTTEKVRHIVDPEAIGNFWNELVSYTKERLMFIIDRSFMEYLEGTGKLLRDVEMSY